MQRFCKQSASFGKQIWGYASKKENKVKKGNFDAKVFYAILMPPLNLDKEADEYEQAEDDVIGDDDVGEAKLLVLGRLLFKRLSFTILCLSSALKKLFIHCKNTQNADFCEIVFIRK